MAFSEIDRVQIRAYLGYAGLWLQVDPRLENAITTVQAVSDGGTRPDNSSEVQIRTYIDQLQAVDAALDQLDNFQGTLQADGNQFNPTREDARLRRKGRMYVFRLAKILDTEPRADVFDSSSGPGEIGLRAGPAYQNVAGNGRTAY